MRKLILLFILLASASLAFGQASVTYTNAGTTGTTLNYLASINTSNNAVLTQSITTEARIVVAGAGTSGLAVLAVSGQANCNMDATVSSNAGGYYVIANASTGQCHPQSTAPTPGTWVVGTLASSSTSSGSVALVNISSYFYAGTSVASVTNNDSTLTISPNTGAVIASLNLGNANTWTAIQTITNSDLHLLGSSTGYTTFTSANASATNYTLTIPANTGTLAELNLAQTFSALQTFSTHASIGSTAHGPLLSENTSAAVAAGAGTAGQIFASGGASADGAYIDFPERYFIPAANCNNTTGGTGWSIPSGGTVICRAGTNNLGGAIQITDTSSTFAQFTLMIPEDWDTGTLPYIRFYVSAVSDTTSGHTIIPQIKVSCPTAGNGTVSDDATFSAAQSSSTVTLGASAVANGFYNGSNVQIGSTQMTGCIAGGMMIVQVGRATDTVTGNVNFWGADVTFPRLLTVQAN